MNHVIVKRLVTQKSGSGTVLPYFTINVGKVHVTRYRLKIDLLILKSVKIYSQ